MSAKIMKRTLCMMLTVFLMLSASAFALPESGTLSATVNGSAISSGDTIPADSTIMFTVPYALANDEAVTTNVVFEESNKAATVTWNLREFSYELDGDTLTVVFPLGTLAMNGSYRFTFKDPAGVGADQLFAFTTTAVGGYAMYDNFDRYPVGVMRDASKNETVAWRPYATSYLSTAAGHLNSKTEIVKVNNDSVLRMTIDPQYFYENLVTYVTGFSASFSDRYVKGITEVEFQIAPVNANTIFEMAGIGIVATSDTQYKVYAKTTYQAINSTSYSFKLEDWTELGVVSFGSKAERDAKHTLSFVTTTDTNTHDARKLNAVTFDGEPVGESVIDSAGMDLATGNHSAVPQGILFSNKGASQTSTTFGLANAGSNGGGYMDIYSLSYRLKAPVMELSVSDSSQFPVNDGVSITFDEAPTPGSGTVKSILENNIVVKKGNTTITGWTLTENSSTSYLLTAPFENDQKYTVTIPDITYSSVVVQGDSINFTTDWKQLTVSGVNPDISLPANGATSGTISLTIPADTYALTNLTGGAVDYQAVLALYRKDGQSPAKQVDEEILTAATVPAGGAYVPAISVSYTDEEYDSSVKYFAKLFFISDDDITEAKALAEPVIFGTPIPQGTHSAANLTGVNVTANTDTATLEIKGTYSNSSSYENRALWVVVTNDNGSDVFYDQLTGGTDGKYALSLIVDPQPQASQGYYNEYTVYVVPSQGFADDNWDEFEFDNVKPSADPSNIAISDNGTESPAARTLTASYVYFDALKRPEAGTTVTWKYADTATATSWTAVAGDATDDVTLTVTEDLVGKYITCVVIPKNAEAEGVEYDYLDDASHDAFLVENLAPQVDTLTIANDGDRKLTATYTLEDPLDTDRTVDTSEIKWYIADSADGTYSEITETLTNPAELPLIVDYAGKYIKCTVTPEYNDGANYWDTGRTYDSKVDFDIAPHYVKYRPVFKNLSLTQNGNTITVDTTLNDPLGHEADVPDITWTFKDGDSVVKTISGTPVQTSYAVSKSDKNLTLIVTAVPKIKADTCDAGSDCVDILEGDAASTEPFTISYESTSVGNSFGGGISGVGGGNVKVPGLGNPGQELSAPAYQSPEGSAAEGAIDFPDVRGHWAEKEIFSLYDAGIVKGRTENSFEPDGSITRAEFLTILVRAMDLEVVTNNGAFADVNASDWYADILATAKANGIFEGSEGNAYPNRAISREEMVTMIVRAYEKVCGEIKVGGGLLDFTDASAISTWAQSAVIKASEIGLVNGIGDGSFAPKANTTRAASAVIIVRFIPHLEKAAEAKAEAEKKAAEEAAKAEVEEAVTEETAEETTVAGVEETPATEE